MEFFEIDLNDAFSGSGSEWVTLDGQVCTNKQGGKGIVKPEYIACTKAPLTKLQNANKLQATNRFQSVANRALNFKKAR